MAKYVKLKDLTEYQYRNWKERNCGEMRCINNCKFSKVDCHKWFYHKEVYNDTFLNQKILIKFESPLDNEEKKYLSSIIKPFKSKVDKIEKMKIDDEYSCIKIQVKVPGLSTKATPIYDNIFLPRFKTDKKYVGMEQYRSYTLKELEL